MRKKFLLLLMVLMLCVATQFTERVLAAGALTSNQSSNVSPDMFEIQVYFDGSGLPDLSENDNVTINFWLPGHGYNADSQELSLDSSLKTDTEFMVNNDRFPSIAPDTEYAYKASVSKGSTLLAECNGTVRTAKAQFIAPTLISSYPLDYSIDETGFFFRIDINNPSSIPVDIKLSLTNMSGGNVGNYDETLSSSPHQFTVSGLTAGTQYNWRVDLSYAAGSDYQAGSDSKTGTVTTKSATVTPPTITGAATIESDTGITSTSATINYRVSAIGDHSVEAAIEYWPNGNTSGTKTTTKDTLSSTHNGQLRSMNLTNLTPGTTYQAKVVLTSPANSSFKAESASYSFSTPSSTTVTVTPATSNLAMGTTLNLSATTNDSAKDFSWTTSSASIATISSTSGTSVTVTPVATGTVTITAKHNPSGVTNSSTITVTASSTVIAINPTSATIENGRTQTLTASITNNGGLANPNSTYDWATNNSNVATLSSSTSASVVVTAVGTGTATITATHRQSGAIKTCIVTVIANTTELRLNYTSADLEMGKTLTLTASIYRNGSISNPNNVYNWTTSNSNIATVSSSTNNNVVVTPVRTGNVTITAKHPQSGATISANIYVIENSTTIKIDPSSATVYIGTPYTLTASITKNGSATNSNFTWATSNSSTATVSSSGVVNPIRTGTVTITATHTQTGATATANLTVQAATVIKLEPSTLTTVVGSTYTMRATVVSPSTANSNFTWSSSNTSVASVSSAGVVTSHAIGTATITATHTTSGVKATSTITVRRKFAVNVDGFSFQNTYSSFGYTPYVSRIPLERYQAIFPAARAQALYDAAGTWGGSCFGFSTVSLGLFNNKILRNNLQSNATTTYGVSAPGRPDHAVTKLLEGYQISQSIEEVNKAINANLTYLRPGYANRISQFISAVDSFAQGTGDPVMLLIFSGNYGHAVVPYEVVRGNTEYTINVYDNNYPNQTRTLKIANNLQSWSFVVDTTRTWRSTDDRGYLSYLSSNYVADQYATKLLQNNSLVYRDNPMLLNANTIDLTIYSNSDPSKKDIKDDHRVILVSSDFSEERGYYSLPNGDYTVTFNSTAGGQSMLSFCSGSDELYMQATLASGQAVFNVKSDGVNDTITLGSLSKEIALLVDIYDVNGNKTSLSESVSTGFELKKTSAGVVATVDGQTVLEDQKPGTTNPGEDTKPGTPDDTKPGTPDDTKPGDTTPPTGTTETTIVLTIGSKVVTQNGVAIASPDVAPRILNGRTMLPFRYLIQDLLGGMVNFDPDTYEITAYVNGHTFQMTIDDPIILVDGEEVDYGQAPVIIDDRTLVPVRVFETVFTALLWDEPTQTVTIIR